MPEILRPIPSLNEARELKKTYRNHPIDKDNPLFDEPLVRTKDYGLEGDSYYSKPNNATIYPVKGVSSNIFVRRTVAEKLAVANDFIGANDGLAALFDGRLELYVVDGFRSPVLQAYLHDTVIPGVLRFKNPDWTDEQVAARVKQVIAFPEWSQDSMSPHFTGGAVDLSLRIKETGITVPMGHDKLALGEETVNPDHLEKLEKDRLLPEPLIIALYARRALYNVMRSTEIGSVSMENNPNETWHYSLYDQMWAILRDYPAAFYGVPPDIPEELHLDKIELEYE